MNAPHVLMISPTGVLGGAERLLLDLVSSADAGGFRASVVLLRDGPLREQLSGAGSEPQLVDAGRFRQAGRTATTMYKLGRVISRLRPDAVYSNMATAHLYASLPAWSARLPSFWHQTGVPSPASAIDRVASALPARCVLAVSREAARAQLRIRPGPPVALFHPGVSSRRLDGADGVRVRGRYGIGQSVPLVGIVGRLQEWKGQRAFLHAAAEVLRAVPEARFAVVGGAILGWEGDYPLQLRRLADDLELGDRVIFTGHADDVPDWLDAIDIVVNASAPEPFGIVVIEAMMSGAVVVAVRAGGPADIITDGVDGLLCPAAEPEILAARILEAVTDRPLRTRLARSAQERAKTRFGVERMAEDFGAIVRACLRPTAAVMRFPAGARP